MKFIEALQNSAWLFVIGSIMIVGSRIIHRRNSHLAFNGRRVIGTVLYVVVVEGNKSGPSYHAEVQYSTQEAGDLLNTLVTKYECSEGQKLKLLYDPNEPQTPKLATEVEAGDDELQFRWVGVLMLVVGLARVIYLSFK